MPNNQQPQNIKYAGFWIRFAASLFDTLFLAVPIGLIIYTLSGGSWFDMASFGQNIQAALRGDAQNALMLQPTKSLAWELAFEFSILIITAAFWRRWSGATPGKRFVGIKVVDAKSFGEVSMKQAITRSLGYIPALLLLGAGFIIIIFRKDKRGMHDMMADTAVIYNEYH